MNVAGGGIEGMKRMRNWGIAIALLGISIGLSGCSQPEKNPNAEALEQGLSLSAASNEAYECLIDKGWDVKLSWDGGIEVSGQSVPAAQKDVYDADRDACWGPINERILNMDSSAIADVYQAELKTRDCLTDLGYEVGEPPSEQEYIDTFQGIRWSAYGDSNVDPASDDKWRDANITCPQPAWSLGAS